MSSAVNIDVVAIAERIRELEAQHEVDVAQHEEDLSEIERLRGEVKHRDDLLDQAKAGRERLVIEHSAKTQELSLLNQTTPSG